MASSSRQRRGGGKGSSREEDRLSDPLLDRDLARRTGGLAHHARRWKLLSAASWKRALLGFAVLALLVLVVTGARAADGFVAVPERAARVTDQAGLLTDSQRSQLDGALADYERRTGSQIAILLVPSTEPEAIEQYSIRVADAWKLGRKGIDDGVLLVVAKNNSSSLRRLRIEAGRGVQGSLTDAQSKRILQDVIAPHFRQGDFYGGLAAGIGAIEALMDKEHFPAPAGRAQGPATATSGVPASGAASAGVAAMAEAAGAGAIPGANGNSPASPAAPKGDGGRPLPDESHVRHNGDGGFPTGWLFPALLLGFFVLLPILRGSRRGLQHSGWGSNASGVLIGAALGNALNAAQQRSGGFGGFSGGDFGGGGGFSGGGGSFDGGGASGDW